MKTPRLIGIVALAVVVLVTLGSLVLGMPRAQPEPSAVTPEAQTQPETASGPGLHIASRTGAEVEGHFTHESSTVEFEARLETPLKVSAQVRLGDLVLDGIAELEENGDQRLVVFDGHGGALLPEQKLTLTALTQELGLSLYRFVDQSGRPLPLPPHELLLMQVVLVSGEAPAGYRFMRREERF
jgi:hypothetical protein